MLVHIVTPFNAAAYAHLLDQMFRQRAHIFIDRLGWTALAADNGRERDSYDAIDTVEYLITTDAQGAFVGACRMLPTTGDYLLSGPLASYLDRPCPQGPTVWEMTRYAPSSEDDQPDANAARAALLMGAVEWGVRRGASEILGIATQATMAYVTRMGLRTTLYGMPRTYEGGGSGAAMGFGIDRAALEMIRAFFRAPHALTFEDAPFDGAPMTAARASRLHAAVIPVIPAPAVRERPAAAPQGRPADPARVA